jgi:putative ABC transport system permease protein
MFDLDLWNEILSALKKNRLAQFYDRFWRVLGYFHAHHHVGSGRALENGVLDGVRAFATNSAFFWTERTSVPYEVFSAGDAGITTIQTSNISAKTSTKLNICHPGLFGWQQNGDNTVRGERTGAFNIYGDYPDYYRIDQWTPVKGRLINEIDVQQKRKVCNIGERVVEVMFGKDEDPIGQYLKISGVYFQVVGVIHPETRINIGGGKKEKQLSSLFSTMQTAYNYGDVVHFFSVTAKKRN